MTTANPTQTNTRWDEITNIWQRDKWLYGLIGLTTGFIFGIAASDYLGRFVAWFAGGFWNEALSIAITVIVLDRLNKFRVEQERKEELIFQMGSEESVVAKEAARLLRFKGWLTDGSLKNTELEGANLEKADLVKADLEGANLRVSNLRSANLMAANLSRSNLGRANLQGSYLMAANLENAFLFQANLYGADLQGASLDNAIWNFNLGSQTFSATLPDGSKWTPDRDMREFTHPRKWAAEQAAKELASDKPESQS